MKKVTDVYHEKSKNLSLSPKRLSSFLNKYFVKFMFWRNRDHFSVAMKLNIVNVLIILSGFFSIIGAYQIQMGGKMHELNYFHQKYITHLVKAVKTFEATTSDLNSITQNIRLIKQQPVDCLNLVGPIELFMMKLINTDSAIQVCKDDLEIANTLIESINAYKLNELDKASLLTHLHIGIEGFERSGVKFEPLVGETVKITFFIVISIIIAKAFIVPIFGLTLSRSVARDYQALSRTKANLEKEKNHSALIQSERMASLNTLVAGVAHEVNTPVGISITANSYSCEMLSQLQLAYTDGKLTEKIFCHFFKEMEDASHIISNNLIRTSSLVDSFKIISVDQSIEKLSTIELKPYIEQVLVSLSPLTKKSDLVINFTCKNGLQAHIYSGALIQVITNIVTNTLSHAFKYKKSGTLSVSVTKSSESEIHLSFEDDGCGIPETDLVHIFEPFFTTGRGRGNTGLGLHILHNLVVDKLKGRVSCVSEIDKGTRFDIYLPSDGSLQTIEKV
jgi:signal transduction histidine kinase